MNINNLFFYIHYCKCTYYNDFKGKNGKLIRTLQHHELIFVPEGKGSIIIDKKKYPIKEGMLFYIRPYIQQTIEIDTGGPGCFLTVHFSYAHVSFNDSRWNIRNQAEGLPLQAAQEMKEHYYVNDIFKKMVDSWNSKLPGYEFITRTLLQQLLAAYFQNTSRQDRNYSVSLKVEKIISYMHEHIADKMTLTGLAESAQLSPAYLSRSFKEITGYSAIEFLNRIRIDKAKELIIEGNKKVREVAHELGFADEFYFSRIFKKIEGASPSEYYNKNVHGV